MHEFPVLFRAMHDKLRRQQVPFCCEGCFASGSLQTQMLPQSPSKAQQFQLGTEMMVAIASSIPVCSSLAKILDVKCSADMTHSRSGSEEVMPVSGNWKTTLSEDEGEQN